MRNRQRPSFPRYRDGFLLQADLADINQIEAMVNKVKEKAGRVDVLVNNAGCIRERRHQQHEN